MAAAKRNGMSVIYAIVDDCYTHSGSAAAALGLYLVGLFSSVP